MSFITTAAVSTPDLVVSSITVPVSVLQGSALAFSYVATNQGTGASGMHYAGITLDVQPTASNYLAFNTVGALAAAGTQTFSSSVSTAGLSLGIHTLYIQEDFYGNMVTESNESNNVRSVTFNVTSATVTTFRCWRFPFLTRVGMRAVPARIPCRWAHLPTPMAMP